MCGLPRQSICRCNSNLLRFGLPRTLSLAQTYPSIISITHYSRLQLHPSTFSLSDANWFPVRLLWKWACFRRLSWRRQIRGPPVPSAKGDLLWRSPSSSNEAKGRSSEGRWEGWWGLWATLKFPSFPVSNTKDDGSKIIPREKKKS